MIQGTASHVGKSVMVAALCRFYAEQGIRVAPFKAQNMALNSYVTKDGKEMGRSQAFQAQAAGVEPTVDMNPVLLKPSRGMGSQVVLLGTSIGHVDMSAGQEYRDRAWAAITGAFARLQEQYDLLIIEGAGSPAEINLMERDLVNMRVARLAEAPVLLVGDIDRGGVFAHLLGTLELLPPEDRARVRGFLINKFRGDLGLLEPGLRMIEERTGVPTLGVVPFVPDIRVDEEDSVALEQARGVRHPVPPVVDIAVIHLPHISNFTDFSPLVREPDADVRYVRRTEELGDPDLIILPGTKSTIADLGWLRAQGLADAIVRHARAGRQVVGVCGGYQMLGRELRDPQRLESTTERSQGLALLDILTTFAGDKRLTRVSGEAVLPGLDGALVEGYEIHHGRTDRADGVPPALHVGEHGAGPGGQPEGARRDDLPVFGTYLHGLFDHPDFRRFLNDCRKRKGIAPLPASATVSGERDLDLLAELVRWHVDTARLEGLIGGIG